MSTYKLGINIPAGHQEDPCELVLSAKKAGFDAIFPDWSYAKPRIDALIETAKREGMILQSIHAPFNRINTLWERSELTEIALAEQIACVRVCARHEAPLMIIHP